ncbi:MAG: FecR domain-containing protein [Planctomycetota bacterium]
MNEKRLLELIDALLETRISDAERDELHQFLRANPVARKTYLELVELHLMLRASMDESTVEPTFEPTVEDDGSDESSGHGNESSNDWDVDDDERDGRLIREEFATRTSHQLRRSYSSWLAAALLLALVGLIGWGIGDWRRHNRPLVTAPFAASKATLRRLDGAAWRIAADTRETKIATGQLFVAGDTIRIGESSSAEVVLADGSRFILRSGTMLRFPKPSGGERGELALNRGGVEVTASKQAPTNPLAITTPAARLTVLGTQFRLYAGAEDSRVELIEGKVRFEQRVDGQAVEVAAGQYAIASTRGTSDEPLKAHSLEDVWRLRHTIERAGEQVAFSHDGVWLATARFTQVEIWDVASGEPCYQFPAAARYDAMAFTLDNKTLVALSHQGPALHWPFADQNALAVDLLPVAGRLRQGTVSRDGRWLAQSTSVDPGTLAIWNNNPFSAFMPLPALPMKADGIAIASRHGSPQLLASDDEGNLLRWDVATGQELVRYRLESPLHILDATADGRRLVGYGKQSGLILVDLDSGIVRELWPATSVRVNSVRFAADGQAVYAAMADGVARGWNTSDGRAFLALSTGDAQLRSIDLSADGQWLAIAGDRERVTLWHVERKATPMSNPPPEPVPTPKR